MLSQKKRSPPEQYSGSSCHTQSTGQDTPVFIRVKKPSPDIPSADHGSELVYLGLVREGLQVRVVSVRDESVSVRQTTDVMINFFLIYVIIGWFSLSQTPDVWVLSCTVPLETQAHLVSESM